MTNNVNFPFASMRTNQSTRCVFCCEIPDSKNFSDHAQKSYLFVENFQRFYGDHQGAVSKKYLTEKTD